MSLSSTLALLTMCLDFQVSYFLCLPLCKLPQVSRGLGRVLQRMHKGISFSPGVSPLRAPKSQFPTGRLEQLKLTFNTSDGLRCICSS